MTDTGTSVVAPATDTKNKALVALRYLGSNATGGLAVFVALGTLTPDQQVQILKSANTIYNSSHDIIGALANIWYIVFPVLGIWLAKFGINASGFGTMMDKVFAAAKAGNKEAALSIVTAAASPDLGTKAIINPMMAADPSTPATVAVSVAALPSDVKKDIQ